MNIRKLKDICLSFLRLLAVCGVLLAVGSCISQCDKEMVQGRDECVPKCAPHLYTERNGGHCICDITKEVK